MTRWISSSLAAALLLAVVSACASAPGPTPPSAPPPPPAAAPRPAPVDPVVRTAPQPDPALEPVRAVDRCAEFNAREAEAARRHREPGECPHCPCACVNGDIRCAPCARCDPQRMRELSVPKSTKASRQAGQE